MGESPTREGLIKNARNAVTNHSEYVFDEVRPIPIGGNPPFHTDCAGFITLMVLQTGVGSPDVFNGSTYTGTLLDKLQHIPYWTTMMGDLVVFGQYPGEHSAILSEGMNTTWNPNIISFGFQGGPTEHSLVYEVTSYWDPGTPITFLKLF